MSSWGHSRLGRPVLAPISGAGREDDDQIGFIDERTRAIFGRSYAAEPHVLIEQLRRDEAITATRCC